MACNVCEDRFNSYQSVVVSIERTGAKARVYVTNQGRNVVMIRRILLCYTDTSGWGVLYLRPPPDQISWAYPSAFLEDGGTAFFYELNATGKRMVQAHAEYIEIDGRSRSCSA